MSRARTPGCCMLRPAARLTSHVRRHWRGARFVRTVSVDPNLGADLGEEGPRLSTRAEKRDFAVAQFSQIAGAAPHLAARLPDFGILRPNPVQRVAFDPIYEGKDVVLEAPTGYGKTLAFALPLLSKLELRRAEPQVLVLCPTRELAVQTYNKLNKLADFGRGNRKGNSIRVGKLTGSGSGSGHSRGINATLARGPHVLVATPQVVNKLARTGTLDLFRFRSVVLDEADALLASDEHARLLHRILKELQFVFVSATPPAAAITGDLPWRGRATAPDHIRVGAHADLASQAVKHHALVVPTESHRYDAVLDLFRPRRRAGNGVLRPPGCAAVFVNRGHHIPPLQRGMQEKGIVAGTLYGGDLAQVGTKKERQRTLRAMGKGRLQACLATDMLARGMDLEGLTDVVLADAPASWHDYVHRAGRVGRFRDNGTEFGLSEGRVVSVVTEEEHGTLAQWAAEAGVEITPCPADLAL